MTVAIVVITILGMLCLSLGLAFLVARHLVNRSAALPRPCYRCGIIADRSYMGLDYCTMCCVVVVQMLPAVRHDPPYGFPGASGCMEFKEPSEAKLQEKKEN